MESEDKSKSDFVDVIDDGPGPNMYMLPTLIGQTNHDPRKPQQPAFSLTGRRHSERVPEHPAPNSYQTSYMTRYGHETAGKVDPTLKDRFPEPRVKVMPGPKYDVTKPTKVTRLSQAPEYSLRGRIQHKPPNLQFPGPNQVNLPTYINGTGQTVVGKSSPAYLLASRVTRTEIDMETPGPLEYAATPLDVTKTAAPKTLMSGRPSRKVVFDVTPGPKYDGLLNPIGKSGPMFSISSRYRPRVSTMRTKEDDAPIAHMCELG